VRDATGAVTAVTVISKEITDRKRMEEELRALSLSDELTGLLNRRGFFTLVEQELRIANRIGKNAVLFLVDIDGLEVINDTCGHSAGDQAIQDTADILRRSFRESDVLARIGGDEFVIFMIEHTGVDPSHLSRRLQDVLRIYNSQVTRSYTLSLSMRWSRYEPTNPSKIDMLIHEADTSMYDQKRARNVDRGTT
jgi:diguanylate cyclase (GGDEF)-like protein